MKGRSVTAEQKRFHDRLAHVIGCVACAHYGIRNTHVSIHHIDGRTKPDAHWLVLPLCSGHHQDGTGAPGLIAVHPYKARFEAEYGKQRDLLREAVQCLVDNRFDVPAGALRVAGIAAREAA